MKLRYTKFLYETLNNIKISSNTNAQFNLYHALLYTCVESYNSMYIIIMCLTSIYLIHSFITD